MIIWGGYNSNALSDGGLYNPSANSWSSLNTNSTPEPRYYHTALWTGSQMLVWGGESTNTTFFNDGGYYSPTANSWQSMTTSGAPAQRGLHSAVWTGNEMLIWGGANSTLDLNDTAAYTLPQIMYLYEKQ
jgi:N-acetylneuraminic acid mutarotase